MGLLVVTVFILALVGLSEGSCNYVRCMFGGINGTCGAEHYIANMNFDHMPGTYNVTCGVIMKRRRLCSHERHECPHGLTEPYTRRTHDFIYMNYIYDLAIHICHSFSRYYSLKNCVTGTYKQNLKDRITNGVYGDKVQFTELIYSNAPNCTSHKKSILGILFSRRLWRNPYNLAAQPRNGGL